MNKANDQGRVGYGCSISDDVNANIGQLSVPLKAKMPTTNEVFSIVKQVEKEMAGKSLNAETAFSFVEEVKKRVADLIVIEVA